MLRLTPEQTSIMAREARTVARHLSQRHPSLSRDDIAQEAWAAMLATVGSYRPDAGPFGAYCYRVALTACQRYAWKALCLTAAPRRKVATEIAQQRACSVDLSAVASEPDEALTPDAALETCERQRALAQLVAEHLAAGEEGRAVLAVLSGESRSQEAADAAGVDVSRLYYLTKQTKRAIRADKRFLRFT